MRHTVRDGDLAMELVAVMDRARAHSPAGQKLPATVLLIPIWTGSGSPAPIALGLPRGRLPARLPSGRTDRRRPRALGDEAVREALAKGMQSPITASSGVRIEHELRYMIACA